jgi:hypothetical protein
MKEKKRRERITDNRGKDGVFILFGSVTKVQTGGDSLPATILHHLFISLFSIEKQTDDAFSDGKGMQSSHLRS